jgi:membrane fusion protein, multidrug efflux system
VLAAGGSGYWFGALRGPAQTVVAGDAATGDGVSKRGAKGTGGAAKGQGGGGAVPVTLAKGNTAAMPEIITAVGSLRSDESVTLRPEVSGRITAILFTEGQRVEKGTTLVRLDPAINMAEVQQTRANLALSKSKYERAIDLSSKNFISGQARDEAKNTFEVAQAAATLAEARLAKTELKAPFGGIIGLRVVSTGDYVREGADLVNLEAIDPIKVDFRVPETYLRQVKVGQTVDVTLDALPGKTYNGRVIALNPLLDAAGRALVIRAQVRNQDTTLRPGMFARVNLITSTKQDALVVPEEALVPQGTEQFLFRVVDNKAERVKVQTGQRRDGKVEIVNGVEKDDLIVIAGQTRLREGSQVRASGGEETAGSGAKGGRRSAAGAEGKALAPATGADTAASPGTEPGARRRRSSSADPERPSPAS